MKKIIIVFFFLFQIFHSYSQNIFITDLYDSEMNKITRIGVENEDKDLFLAGFFDQFTSSVGEYLVKLDSSGIIIAEYYNSIQDSSISFYGIFLIDAGLQTVSIKQPLNQENGLSTFYIKIFDFDLNLISTKSYSFPDSLNATRIRVKITEKNAIYIYGFAYSYNDFSRDFIYKINNDTSILHFYDSLYRPALHVLNNNSICLTSIYENTCNNYGSLIFLDSNLIINNYICFDEEDSLWIEDYDNILPINDNKYIFNGLGSCNTNNFRILDSNFNVIKQSLYDNYTYMEATGNNMDFQYSNHIYVSNMLNFQTYCLTKTDSALNNIFQKIIYLSDNYILNGITATRDSGCLMIATISKDVIGARAIKFDQYGNLPTNLPSDIKISDFAVYPNPASNFINIKKVVQIEQAEFVLYNSAGQMVLQTALNNDITQLDVSVLQQGVYVYNIVQNGKIVDRGKTIVE